MLDGMLKYTLQTYLGQRHPGFLMRINGRVSQFPLCFHVFSRVSVADFHVDEAPKSLKGAVTVITWLLRAFMAVGYKHRALTYK